MGGFFDFFKNLWENIKDLFDRIDDDLKNYIHIGVTVTENMKNFVESGFADIATALIPGDVDDLIKEKLREFLPRIVVELKLADKCANLTDPNEILKCAIETLQQIGGDWISDDAKKNFYNSLAVMIATVVSDGKLTWDDSQTLAKWYYDNIYKAKK